MCKTRQTVEMEVSLLVYRDIENMWSVTDSFLQGTPNSKNVCFTYFEEMRSLHAFLGKTKAIPVQPRTGPEFSWRMSLPDFMTVGTRRW
jgi:hypothetical protein